MSDVVLDAQALDGLDHLLERLSHRDTRELRVGNGWGNDSKRHAVVAAALMGNLRDRELTVLVDDDAVTGFLRTGLASALARRTGTTHFRTTHDELDADRLGAFWTAGTRSVNSALFAPDTGDERGPVGSRYATFVNAHLASGTDGTPPIVYLVRRWLTRQLRPLVAASATKAAVDTVGAVLRELVSNVHEHAPGQEAPSPDSLIRLSIEDTVVRCTVVDNGIGIARSLTRRDPSLLLNEETLSALLRGDVQGWHQGRGIGLPKVVDLVSPSGGTVFLATGSLRIERRGDSDEHTEDGRFDVRGTAVDVVVPT